MAIQIGPKIRPAAQLYAEKVAALPDVFPAKQVTRKPGRPASGKVVVTLRLAPDVVAKFKATGPGWQSRMNDTLAKAVIPPG